MRLIYGLREYPNYKFMSYQSKYFMGKIFSVRSQIIHKLAEQNRKTITIFSNTVFAKKII